MILEPDERRLVETHVFRTYHQLLPIIRTSVDEFHPELDIARQTRWLRHFHTLELVGLAFDIERVRGTVVHAYVAVRAEILVERRVRLELKIGNDGGKNYPRAELRVYHKVVPAKISEPCSDGGVALREIRDEPELVFWLHVQGVRERGGHGGHVEFIFYETRELVGAGTGELHAVEPAAHGNALVVAGAVGKFAESHDHQGLRPRKNCFDFG